MRVLLCVFAVVVAALIAGGLHANRCLVRIRKLPPGTD